MDQKDVTTSLVAIAKQLLRISQGLNRLYLDQIELAGNITSQNMFKIEPAKQRIVLANQLFSIHFHRPERYTSLGCLSSPTLFDMHFVAGQPHAEALEEFFLHEIYFLTGDRKPQHSLLLRSKAQKLKQLLLEYIYQCCKVEQRAEAFLQQITQVQAEITDHLMIKAKYYKTPILQNFRRKDVAIPEAVIEQFKTMFRFDLLMETEFLPVQNLMESFDEFGYTATQFLDAPVYRVMSLNFVERFNLNDLQEHRADIELLYRHALEQPKMLGFLRLMHREVWQQPDILSKQHFVQANTRIWQKKAAKLPLFDGMRTVNWLYRQSSEVIDWISENIQHSSVRVAMTAMSFIDCSQQHPQIILATLQYFQYAAARMFISRCYEFANQEQWFEHPNNTHAVLQGTQQAMDDHRIAISHSILYLDEWMALVRCIAREDQTLEKRVYASLSRVMQAYLQHLSKITQPLATELIAFIRPETQQNRDFHSTLRRHRIQLDDFRQRFYLVHEQSRESLFDAYVRDYLTAYFAENKVIAKNVTWFGLYQQAIVWHDEIQKEEIMTKLKKDCLKASWSAWSHSPQIQFEQWLIEELTSIDRIIQESKVFRHCLAASYAHRIIEGEYVAFHVMPLDSTLAPMTLGCVLQNEVLIFDQLEHAHNKKAQVTATMIACRFIEFLNLRNQQSI